MLNIKKLLITILLFNGVLFAISTDNNLTSPNETVEALKKSFKKSPSVLLKNIPHKKILTNFYKQNNYSPLWIQNDLVNEEKYAKLFKHIQEDITLSPKSLIYKNYQTLSKQLDTNLSHMQMLRAEIKLSSLYYDFLVHTIYGEIQWKKFSYKLSSLKKSKINASWIKSKPKLNIQMLMRNENIDATMKEALPKNFGYAGLLVALKQLETLKEKGTWEKLPHFKRLALGSTGDIVLKLRARLETSGDYLECNETDSYTTSIMDTNLSKDINLSRDAVFGHCLDKAVKTFQQRHGLVIDGIVGGGTQKALNVSIDEKIHQIRLNIDRIKWLPREEHERYLIVNIPEFMLHYIEEGEVKQKLRVIVGDKRHPTPVFSQNISYIVLNPYWKVPEGIVKREIIPAMVKNRNYLKRQGLEAHRTWDEKSRLIDTSWLYWEDYLYGNKKFPYRLMQPPGPKNALGKIKFKFPNRFSVYLHDTPTKHLFNKSVRAFSHGCVRLSQPEELLETIAKFNPEIDMNKANKTLKGKRKKFLSVNNQLRIYLVYLTAGINEKGQIEFRNDIYNYDKYQKRRLR
ncbi:MAG: L,D-transpeptidase YcbB [uncultured Sulfurovum sp.]|uniref:L,D-transpeptidase YcbB n=1 Tax=uncultured Sulfurovum sp. TaxID=269237 RepID=A0A6S6TLU1_9BACT|nr:MAG: L,D-transpeptidase YcbB [uncultured Sulfurovum sp.]